MPIAVKSGHEIPASGIKEIQCLNQDVEGCLAYRDRTFVTNDRDQVHFSLEVVYINNHK